MRRTALLPASMALGVLLVCGALLVALEEPAQAAFPGKNGKIVFANREGYTDYIYSMDADGSNRTLLQTNGTNPTWSPDGRKVAFDSDVTRSGNPGYDSIYVMDANGTNARKLTGVSRWEGNNYQPAWSPDSARIAFISQDRSIYTDALFVMGSGGSGPTLVTNGGGYANPAWSPDGSRIAVERRDGSGIYTVKPDGSERTYLGVGRNPSWSPDGSKIAFSEWTGSSSGTTYLYVMNADGSGKRLLAEGREPAWSPDGSKIVYSYPWAPGGTTEIHTVSVEGPGGAGYITDGYGQKTVPDWQPDRAPGPVGNFAASVDGHQASLSWENPTDTDFTATRILRSTAGFAESHLSNANQALVYEGPGATHADTELSEHTSYYYTAYARDADGYWSRRATAYAWIQDATSPGGRVAINGGKARTGSRSVTLNIDAADASPGSGVSMMRVKNGGGSWGRWTDYAPRKAWGLTNGAGNKTVYVQFEDAAGNASALARDSIRYRP